MDGAAARSINKNDLRGALLDAHCRGWELLADLEPAQWRVPYRSGINPPLWELAHVSWFTEWWTLRQQKPLREPGENLRAAPLFPNADPWFDSSIIPHRERWQLPLPECKVVEDYRDAVLDRAIDELATEADSDEALYFYRLALFHADMHNEALAYMRQSLDYAAPSEEWSALPPLGLEGRDTEIAASHFDAGYAMPGFAFDNETPVADVSLGAYAIAREPVSNAEFARFVESGAYADPRWWTEAGRQWFASNAGNNAPLRWQRGGSGQWEQRWFGASRELVPAEPVCHVNAFEAEAYCRWSKRRLPTELEWEYAAINGLIEWGTVWEWTADAFLPRPGFAAGPYRDYSQPWFGSHRSVRGASIATHPRMRHPRYRNFYTPERNDIFAGFRTCAI
ncbi:MAG: SUMF1/EgtB/PvdO family nonheme iron enzyme [Candidatus Eremiobacteraeota bacterium]|nr:SUMF1/EgtB/PvdO family nonheme iron enzyme [Candidatus Eremiobacteraeota bacterium]